MEVGLILVWHQRQLLLDFLVPLLKHKEKVVWLQKRLDLPSELVQTIPSVFACSIEEYREPNLAWLNARLKLDDKDTWKLVKTR